MHIKQSVIGFLKQHDVVLASVLASVILSLIWLAYQQPLNLDGIEYLQLSQLYLSHGLKATMAHYAWCFYPVLIASLSQLTHLGLYASAQILNTLLIALILVAYILNVKTLGANKKMLWIAFFAILFFPELAHERYMIYRDFGYYAFMLLGCYCLLQFGKDRSSWKLILWALFTFLGALFRIEGLVFLALMPLALLFWPESTLRQRVKYFFYANLVNLLLGIIALLYLGFKLYASGSAYHHILALVNMDFLHSIQGVKQSFMQQQKILDQHLLSIFGIHNARIILISAYVAIFLSSIYLAIGFIYFILALYGFKHKMLTWSAPNKLVIFFYIILNCIILITFASEHLFITTRYTVFLGLLIMLFSPFGVLYLWENYPWTKNLIYHNKRLRLNAFVRPSLLACALYLFISASFHIGVNKNYYIRAGKWVQTHIGKEQRFSANSIRLVYYLNHPGTTLKAFKYGVHLTNAEFLSQLNKKAYNYVAIDVPIHEISNINKQIKALDLKPIKNFYDNRGDVIMILKIHKA